MSFTWESTHWVRIRHVCLQFSSKLLIFLMKADWCHAFFKTVVNLPRILQIGHMKYLDFHMKENLLTQTSFLPKVFKKRCSWKIFWPFLFWPGFITLSHKRSFQSISVFLRSGVKLQSWIESKVYSYVVQNPTVHNNICYNHTWALIKEIWKLEIWKIWKSSKLFIDRVIMTQNIFFPIWLLPIFLIFRTLFCNLLNIKHLLYEQSRLNIDNYMLFWGITYYHQNEPHHET